MAKFKVGDKVRVIRLLEEDRDNKVSIRDIGIIIENDRIPDVKPLITKHKWGESNIPFEESQLELVGGNKTRKPKPTKFILKYELDKDPYEEFPTMKAVKERIDELVKDENLKRDSMVVFTIKDIKKVEIKEKIIISNI